MTARPHRIDTDARSGKRRDVAAAWSRLRYLRMQGFEPDGAGGWTYRRADDATSFYPRHACDGPVPDAVAARLSAYVAAGDA